MISSPNLIMITLKSRLFPIVDRDNIPVAKAQHEPHIPWSFTGVITPSSLQSFFSGKSFRLTLLKPFAADNPVGLAMFNRPLAYCALNSSSTNKRDNVKCKVMHKINTIRN